MIETTDGVTGWYVSLKVPVEEMRDWEPERISQFFGGIALMLAAQRDTLPVAAPLAPPAADGDGVDVTP